jgi:signal transduction histidine kinase
MQEQGEPDPRSEEHYRREALGAFAHEVRTPLTAIRMVLELGRATGDDAPLLLDGELASMLRTSVDDLQRLADDLQETSRLERGRLRLAQEPCDLAAIVTAARHAVAPDVLLDGEAPPLAGHWDEARLVHAIAGLARGANRAGDGSGRVSLRAEAAGSWVELALQSGHPGGAGRPIASDAGYAFFRARQAILAMGGRLDWDRAERYLLVRASLPRRP